MLFTLLFASADARRDHHHHARQHHRAKGIDMADMFNMKMKKVDVGAMRKAFGGIAQKMKGMDKAKVVQGMEAMINDGRFGSSVATMVRNSGETFSTDFKAFASSCGSTRRLSLMNFDLKKLMDNQVGKRMGPMIAKTIELFSTGGKGMGKKLGHMIAKAYNPEHKGDFLKIWKSAGLKGKDGKSLKKLMSHANCLVAQEAAKMAGAGRVTTKHIIDGVAMLFENQAFLTKTFEWGEKFVKDNKMMAGFKMMMMPGMMMMGKMDFTAKMKEMLKSGKLSAVVKGMLEKSDAEFSRGFKEFAGKCKSRRRIAGMIQGGKALANVGDAIAPMMKNMMKNMMSGDMITNMGGKIGAMVSMMYHTKPGMFAQIWKMAGLAAKPGQELEMLMNEANCMVAKTAVAAAGKGNVTTEQIVEAVAKLFENKAFLEKSFKWGQSFVESSKQ